MSEKKEKKYNIQYTTNISHEFKMEGFEVTFSRDKKVIRIDTIGGHMERIKINKSTLENILGALDSFKSDIKIVKEETE